MSTRPLIITTGELHNINAARYTDKAVSKYSKHLIVSRYMATEYTILSSQLGRILYELLKLKTNKSQ